jgi:hypothetical protein
MENRAATITASWLRMLAFALTLAVPILAQSPRPPSTVDPARTRFEDNSRREMELRGLGGTGKPGDPKQVEAIVAQVKQDFERLLVRHNEIVRAIHGDQALNHDFVSSATAEVKKRASRLQTNLALARPDGSERPSSKPPKVEDAQVKDALITLCKRIESFAKNPVIVNPQTVDARQSARAREDLEEIILLGDTINKTAERLKKNPR